MCCKMLCISAPSSDYGFMHSDGFVGACIRDPTVQLDDPCLTGKVTSYYKSTGYRKIPGDVCAGGVEATLEPQLYSCCETPTGQPTDNPVTTKMAVTTHRPTTQPTTEAQTTKPRTQADSTKPQTSEPTTEADTTNPRPGTDTPPTTTKPGTNGHTTGNSSEPTGPTVAAPSVVNSQYLATVAALGVLLALAVLVAVILAALTAMFAS